MRIDGRQLSPLSVLTKKNPPPVVVLIVDAYDSACIFAIAKDDVGKSAAVAAIGRQKGFPGIV